MQPLELQRNAMDIDMDHICKHQLFGYILIPQYIRKQLKFDQVNPPASFLLKYHYVFKDRYPQCNGLPCDSSFSIIPLSNARRDNQ